MIDDLPGSDLRLLREKFKTAKPAKTSSIPKAGSTAERRAKLEARRALSETDGRRKPAGEIRDVQMNFKVSRAEKQRMLAASRTLGITLVDVWARGLALVEAEIARGKKD